jgi:hypothetical protein
MGVSPQHKEEITRIEAELVLLHLRFKRLRFATDLPPFPEGQIGQAWKFCAEGFDLAEAYSHALRDYLIRQPE